MRAAVVVPEDRVAVAQEGPVVGTRLAGDGDDRSLSTRERRQEALVAGRETALDRVDRVATRRAEQLAQLEQGVLAARDGSMYSSSWKFGSKTEGQIRYMRSTRSPSPGARRRVPGSRSISFSEQTSSRFDVPGAGAVVASP